MTFEELSKELLRLSGQNVSFVRLAGNSIIVYFFGGPGDKGVVSLFIDPTWRIEREQKVIIGSYDFQMDETEFGSKSAYEAEFDRRAALAHALDGAILAEVSIDSASSDVAMAFQGELVLRKFVNSAYDTNAWTYRDGAQGLTAIVSPRGITIRQKGIS